ncbi:hypothetical protein LTR85_003195 [Meristemomyces frigidus]|nr:hypothetical protein LTR85_003195 [Meristemomyces frigidus]
MPNFRLNDTLEGLNVALINVGSVLGGLFAGQICDKWGRKMGIAASAAITIVAVAIQASATKEAAFCVGRVLLGMAVTVNGVAAPTWVMEMAHPKRRGVLGGTYMATWYLAATIVTAIAMGTYHMTSTWAWRILAVLQVAPSLLSLSLLPWMPESPRWLIAQDRHEEAIEIFAILHGDGDVSHPLVQAEIKEITDTILYEKANARPWKSLISPTPNLRRFCIVIVLNIAAQVVGSNIMSSYAGVVYDQAGVTSTARQLTLTLGLDIFNLGLAAIGSFVVERLGRKTMLFSATVFMTVMLCIMAVLTALFEDTTNKAAGQGMLAISFFLLGAYSFAWTSLTFVYPVEVLNFTQRAKGLAVGQMACYAFGFVNQYTTPIAIDNIGWRYYVANAAWNVPICAIIWFLFVETKGRSLEEVDELFDGCVHAEGVFVGNGDEVRNKGGDI